MRIESKKYLYDIAHAAELAIGFVAGKSFADYEADPMLRSAVERQLEIVGEGLAQLAKTDTAVASRLANTSGSLPSGTFLFTATLKSISASSGTCWNSNCRSSYSSPAACSTSDSTAQTSRRSTARDDSDGDLVPAVRGIEFGDGDVEGGAEAVFQAADDLALVFERLRVLNAEFEGEVGDHLV